MKENSKCKCLSAALAAAAMCLTPIGLAAAAYPDKPVAVILPFAAGNSMDVQLRIIGEYLQNKHGITILSTPKPGGSGVPASLEMKNAKPDGYTLGYTSANVLTVVPQIKNTGFTYKDFKYVAQLNVSPMVWAIRADLDVKSVADLMEKAKEKGKFNIASSGALTAQRFYHANIMKRFPDSDLPYVPYDGGSQVIPALLGGHVTIAFSPASYFKSHVEAGTVKILATTHETRLPEYPDAPTFTELFGKGFIYDAVYGVVAPAGTPDDRVQRMQELFKEALADPGVKEKFTKANMTTDYLPGAEFGKMVEYYNDVFSEPIKNANIK
jgi:tripartite-type tricarboxylate transporter receptor subunit TctC